MLVFLKNRDGAPEASELLSSELPFRSNKLEIEGNFNEFPLSVGFIPANARVNKTIIEVLNVFDSGTITIGDDDAQGRLVTAAENDLLTSNVYGIENFVKYGITTEIKAYLTGTPTQGRVSIIVFYN